MREVRALSEFSAEVRFGTSPLASRRPGRDPQHFGGLVDVEAAEEAEFDEPGEVLISHCQPVERRIDVQDLLMDVPSGTDEIVLKRDGTRAAPPLVRASRAVRGRSESGAWRGPRSP